MKYAWVLSDIFLSIVWYFPVICLNFGRDMSNICMRFPCDFHDICLIYARDMPNTCLRYTSVISKYAWVCPRHTWDITEMGSESDPSEQNSLWLSEWVSEEVTAGDVIVYSKSFSEYQIIIVWINFHSGGQLKAYSVHFEFKRY